MSGYKIKEALRHLPNFPFEGRRISIEKAEEDSEKYVKLGYGTYYDLGKAKSDGPSEEEIAQLAIEKAYAEENGLKIAEDMTDDELRAELDGAEVKYHAKTGTAKLIGKVKELRSQD